MIKTLVTFSIDDNFLDRRDSWGRISRRTDIRIFRIVMPFSRIISEFYTGKGQWISWDEDKTSVKKYENYECSEAEK